MGFSFAGFAPKNLVLRMNACAVNSPGEPNGGGHILVVDDEDALLEIYSAILKRHYAVTAARNAAEAERCLQHQSFKVIMADHLMPGEAGLDFLTRVRPTFPHVQCVLVTGNMTPEMRERAREKNVLFAYLIKPVSITELLAVIRSAVQLHDASLSAATP
jgi:two-component system phosphate regulon response regulator OmpR